MYPQDPSFLTQPALLGGSSSGVYSLCVSCLLDIYFATAGCLSVSSIEELFWRVAGM